MVDGGQWIVGSLLTWPDGEKYILYDEDFADTGMMNKESVFSKTVGQFTGLFDKNGKEIYEGDIIECSITDYPRKGDIKFHAGSFYLSGLDGHSDEWIYNCADKIVIGNIHDNPELLKEE